MSQLILWTVILHFVRTFSSACKILKISDRLSILVKHRIYKELTYILIACNLISRLLSYVWSVSLFLSISLFQKSWLPGGSGSQDFYFKTYRKTSVTSSKRKFGIKLFWTTHLCASFASVICDQRYATWKRQNRLNCDLKRKVSTAFVLTSISMTLPDMFKIFA